ncbi:MAG: ABC transporter permease [bacterium]|nr:ABC transporter permease [bacterium]
MNDQTLNLLASIVSNATPLVIASLGETITERAGVTNLSLDGSIVLAAMAGFVAALTSGSVIIGLLVAMLVGAAVALLVAFGSIALRCDQVAVGFILTLLCADLAQFLGQEYTRQPGPTVAFWPLPVLNNLPIVGRVLFEHNALVYFSYVLIFAAWWWMFKTRAGLAHRAVGERPEAAYARGVRVNLLRYVYAAAGGALVGLAGASYSLSFKAGWTNPPVMRGDGWIALAIVIFGGWHPFRVVFGAYLFAALRTLSTSIQQDPNTQISPVLLNMLPWIFMIATLLAVSSGGLERLLRLLPRPLQRPARNLLRSNPPAALGTRFDP